METNKNKYDQSHKMDIKKYWESNIKYECWNQQEKNEMT
jgi:hypothetical protein